VLQNCCRLSVTEILTAMILSSGFDLASTLLPATIILLAIAYDIVASRKAWKWLTRPFHDFMALNDLLEPIGPSVKVPDNTSRILFVLATVSSMGWIGCLAFGIYTNHTNQAIRALIFAVCWVNASFFGGAIYVY